MGGNTVKCFKFENGWKHCKMLQIRQECMGVCMSMCTIALLKAKTFKAFAIYFFSLFTGIGQKWVKLLHFVPNHLYQFYLNIFAIVVLINKAF